MQVPKSDYGYELNFTVQTSSGSAYDLTDYTIKLKVWAPGIPSTLILNGSCSIIVAASGTCKYNVASGDFATIGKYLAELEMTKAGIVESTGIFNLEVMESG